MRRHAVGAALGVALWSLLAGSALADPAWKIATATDTVAAPGTSLKYLVQIGNTGSTATDGVTPYTLTVTLPPGLIGDSAGGDTWDCPGAAGASVITCSSSAVVEPRRTSELFVIASVDPAAAGTLTSAFDISGGGAVAPASTLDPTSIGTTPVGFGIEGFDGQIAADVEGNPSTQAGGHPYSISTTIAFNRFTDSSTIINGPLMPVEPVKDIFVDLPPGFVGDPTAPGDRCTASQLANSEGVNAKPLCPSASQVGTATVFFNHGLGAPGARLDALPVPVFNLTQPADVPARFGFNFLGTVVTFNAVLRSAGDYGLSVNANQLPEGIGFVGTTVTFWGVPADSSHDTERACPGQSAPWDVAGSGSFCTSDAPLKPFLRNPTSCTPPGVGLPFALRTDSWLNPGKFDSASFVTHDIPGHPLLPAQWGAPVGITRCDLVPFDPSLQGTPASLKTSVPSGYAFDLNVPQTSDSKIVATGDVRNVVATLPGGVSVSPSSANGLEACSPAQIGLHSDAPASCPDASKVGEVEIHTPLLDDPLAGAIYLATPHENPFNSLVAIYVVANGPGLVVKLAGNVHLDSVTGQITTTFEDNPQLPFDKLHLEFFDGPQAALANPDKSGTYTTHASLTSWSGASVTSDSSFTVTGPARGFSPDFVAGTQNPIAGASTPFALSLSRGDSDQELADLTVDMPRGVLAHIADVPLCKGADARRGTCGAASRVGSVITAAGPGPAPFQLPEPGRAYIAGRYKGAPFSLSIVVPAVAGPFNLGNVVVRAAIHVDRRTSALHIVSDPLPTILEGIPLDVRRVRVLVDRPNFTINPTGCNAKTVQATIGSTEGATAHVSSHFQVAGCSDLPLKPKLRLAVGAKGKTHRGKSTPFTATLTQTRGQANLRSVYVSLPLTVNARLDVVSNACTQAQFDAGQCEQARTGTAVAVTPLLKHALRGGVYFVKDPTKPAGSLPNLIVALRGQVAFDLVGKVKIPGGTRLATNFDAVPDVPITKFTLSLVSGTHGALGVATNLCSTKDRNAKALVIMRGQNGKEIRARQALNVRGCSGRDHR